MSAQEAWSLVYRLFATGAPALLTSMPPREAAVLPMLGRALEPVAPDAQYVLCPACHQYNGLIFSDGQGGRICECPECGPVEVTAGDIAVLALDEDWLRQRLRLAMTLNSRVGIDQVGDDVWRLGHAGHSPVLLARDLYRLWSKPDLLERMRMPGGQLRVVTPKLQAARGSPFGGDVEWLPLEDCFTWYGGGIAFLGQGADGDAAGAVDPTVPVHGPFSADFRWVWLLGEDGPAIACTPGQAAVFKALWEFGGNPRTAEQIMQRAGLASQKPVDVFKGGKYTEAARAYRTIVVTQQRQGLYAMPCAKASSLHCK